MLRLFSTFSYFYSYFSSDYVISHVVKSCKVIISFTLSILVKKINVNELKSLRIMLPEREIKRLNFFVKIFMQISQENTFVGVSFRPVTLSKINSNTGVFHRYFMVKKSVLFQKENISKFLSLKVRPSWHLLVQSQQWKHQNSVRLVFSHFCEKCYFCIIFAIMTLERLMSFRFSYYYSFVDLKQVNTGWESSYLQAL